MDYSKYNASLAQLASAKVKLQKYSEIIDYIFDVTVAYVNEFNLHRDKGHLPHIKNNLPLPNEVVRSGYGKKLGYIRCIIRVFSQIAIKMIVTLTSKSFEMSDCKSFLEGIKVENYQVDLVGDLEEFVFDGEVMP